MAVDAAALQGISEIGARREQQDTPTRIAYNHLMIQSLIVDARMSQSSGIGTYIRGVIPELLPQLRFKKLRLLVRDQALFLRDHPHLAKLPGIEFIEQKSRIYSPQEQIDFLRASSGGFDLFWAPHLNLPWFHPSLLVTVHDTFHLSCRELSAVHERLYMRLALRCLRRHAKAVITVSQFAKSELLRHAPMGSTPVHVIPHGRAEAPVRREAIRSEHPFLLFVGNLKPHKNLKTLVKAVGLLRDQIPHQLWIVGDAEGLRRVDPELERYRHELGDRVRFLGKLEDEKLQELYRSCDAFIAPSVYEGFGLTPIEALLMGAPRVIASRIPAHEEFLGESVTYFDPQSAESLASALARSLGAPPEIRGSPPILARAWSQSVEEHRRVLEGLGF